MPLEIVTLPCRTDNYAFLLHNNETGETALVDAPEAAPLEAALKARGWGLDYILITHHHDDHIIAVATLRDQYGSTVIGAAADAHRLPPLDQEVADGDVLKILGEDMHVLDVSGHTIGHIAFHFPASNAAFTADSLMALGCGRLFEGTPEQAWTSLCALASLPEATIVYSGHEYTQANAKFALTIEADNPALIKRVADIDEARAQGRPTVPSSLALERATNPFLRAAEPSVKAALDMTDQEPLAVFTEIRRRKDNF
ncbi:hydroxyacylglutathione hydrolase [Epibacterium sp. SM1979]|uniref:Hydroxyacylglutathione hydrolase n=1 Tax=Tritonibacter litoralis TaxID=2662264 RepID=A0A843YDM1_9RHOB|nr:hydroxyacylglutathione hydrolase [Tritonibacter litoralis]MQQ09480.1 hydroxyacylglutathione hydrolase [Tritonibacter litoralis]